MEIRNTGHDVRHDKRSEAISEIVHTGEAMLDLWRSLQGFRRLN